MAFVSRPFAFINRLLPRGIGDALLQFALFYVIYQAYQVVRGVTEAQDAIAFANADRIIDVERALGVFFEPGLQASILSHAWLIDAANYLYVNTHFVITTSFLVWLYLFRNRHFYFVRNMFMVAMALALVGYVLFPTAPPRLIPEAGFVDTIATFTLIEQDSNSVSLLVNKYAAVPSMHIGFSMMVAGTAIAIARRRATRAVWLVSPLLVFWVIVITAQHFWLDAAAGAVVAVASALVADRVLARVRPAVWSFRSSPAEAPA